MAKLAGAVGSAGYTCTVGWAARSASTVVPTVPPPSIDSPAGVSAAPVGGP